MSDRRTWETTCYYTTRGSGCGSLSSTTNRSRGESWRQACGGPLPHSAWRSCSDGLQPPGGTDPARITCEIGAVLHNLSRIPAGLQGCCPGKECNLVSAQAAPRPGVEIHLAAEEMGGRAQTLPLNPRPAPAEILLVCPGNRDCSWRGATRTLHPRQASGR
jgi:hypothetical protein